LCIACRFVLFKKYFVGDFILRFLILVSLVYGIYRSTVSVVIIPPKVGSASVPGLDPLSFSGGVAVMQFSAATLYSGVFLVWWLVSPISSNYIVFEAEYSGGLTRALSYRLFVGLLVTLGWSLGWGFAGGLGLSWALDYGFWEGVLLGLLAGVALFLVSSSVAVFSSVVSDDTIVAISVYVLLSIASFLLFSNYKYNIFDYLGFAGYTLYPQRFLMLKYPLYPIFIIYGGLILLAASSIMYVRRSIDK